MAKQFPNKPAHLPAPRRLNCLVVAEVPEYQALLIASLGRGQQIDHIDTLERLSDLTAQLRSAHYDIVLIALLPGEERLPEGLSEYPDLGVLVALSSPADSLQHWLRQGATDVVLTAERDRLQHAVNHLMRYHWLRQENEVLIEALTGRGSIRHLPAQNTDTVTGLLSKASGLKALQALIDGADQKKRYLAMQINLRLSAKTGPGRDRTRQDLALHRASELIQQSVPNRELMARADRDTLLVVRPSPVTSSSRELADFTRLALGNLGSLLGAEHRIDINTLTFSPGNMAAEDILTRLNRQPGPAAGQQSARPVADVLTLTTIASHR